MRPVSPKQNKRGFVIAPILYMLGLIGILGGVMYSSTMQQVRTVKNVQDDQTAKSDLQAASVTLAAQSTFSADNTELCPPRSSHQTSGNPCAAAPVALIQFADFTQSSRLPANFSQASTSGSPAEVGAVAPGAGMKQLDPYGHAFIYCRWEQPRSNSASPAIAIISAGANGNLETKCGDTSAQGDDYLVVLSVAELINRASVWQADASNNASYGATGSKVTVDSNGNLNAAGTVTSNGIIDTGTLDVSGLSTLGSVTTGAATLDSLSVMHNTTIGGVTTMQGVTANSINSGSLTVTGATSLNSLTSGTATIDTASITNNETIGGTLTISGTTTAKAASFTSLTDSGTLTVSGLSNLNILLTSLFISSGPITAGTNLLVNGTTTMLNSLQGTSATFSGAVTASSFSGAFNGTTITTSGVGTFDSLSVTHNASIGGTLNVAGAATMSSVSTGSVNVTGAISGDSLSLAHNASVSGAITATGNITTNTGLIDSGSTQLSHLGIFCYTSLGQLCAFVRMQNAADTIVQFDTLTTNLNAILRFSTAGVNKWNVQKATDDAFVLYNFTTAQNDIRVTTAGAVTIGESAQAAASTAGANTTIQAQSGGTGNTNGGNILLTAGIGSGTGTNGGVGIGTSSPTNPLHVYQNISGQDLKVVVQNAANGYAAYIKTVSNSLYSGLWSNSYAGDWYMGVWSTTAWVLRDITSGGTQPFVVEQGAPNNMLYVSKSNSGAVAIGTNSPQATLDVKGFMRLQTYNSSPATCSSTNAGAIAETHNFTLCSCTGSAWVKVVDGVTACGW